MRHGSSATTFIPKLKHGDDGKDLPLGTDWNGIPLCLRSKVDRWVGGSSKGLWPWEDKVGLDDVSNESKHGNAAMLDFGLTKPANGGFVAVGPEVLFGEIL
jgi:hypothetical protein